MNFIVIDEPQIDDRHGAMLTRQSAGNQARITEGQLLEQIESLTKKRQPVLDTIAPPGPKYDQLN